MAIDDLKIYGNDESTQSYSEFFNLLRQYNSDINATVEDLNKLNIDNVKNLGMLQKRQQEELVNEYSLLRYKANEKDHADQVAKLNERYAELEKLDEEALKAKTGLTKQQLAAEKEQEKKKLDAVKAYKDKQAKKEAQQKIKEEKKQAASEKRKAAQNLANQVKDAKTLQGKVDAIKGIAKNINEKDVYDADGNLIGKREATKSEKISGAIGAAANAMGAYAYGLKSTIEEIASYRGKIDTRLQGLASGRNWDAINKSITGIAGISPLIKQSDVANKVSQMVSQGIAFNVEQRAALDVMKDKIATTFDAANGTLLRLVRIQEQDTTAGRLGMESALTAFLNNMYQTTEYMTDVANSIKGNLEEAMSLMSGENALSFEYQVQKWLGSMYSVGMSREAVQGLGGVLGKLASGQLDAITNGGQGNLVIMAANNAGLSVADILNNGLNSQTTNQLMDSVVDYLAKIYDQAGESKVIQQQLASVYGMTASDLRAAVNLSRSRGAVSKSGLSYNDAINRLYSMAGSMHQRASVGELLSNAFSNFQYTMSAGIANNPALYAIYSIGNLLQDTVGGINIPAFSVMGNMVDLETSVANLMMSGALAGGMMSGIGSMINAAGGGGITGRGILDALKVKGNNTVTRGTGVSLATTAGLSYSESGAMIGNNAGSDIQNKTMTDANDSSQAQLAEAVETTNETKLSEVYTEVVNIYQLLQDIANGSYTLSVDVTNGNFGSL